MKSPFRLIARPACLASLIVLGGCKPSQSETRIATPEGLAEATAESLPPQLPERVSFNEHIQPILSEKCYHCHGPDSGTRAPKDAPLRLDHEEGAFALRENGKPVIVRGQPAESALIQRILTADPDLIMPPPESHKALDAGEIALINRWIEEGGEYEPHWAFVPFKKTPLPPAGAGWVANPIDSFIAEKLEQAGLQPNPPENPRRFYRRLHLDLTGLPPAPAALDAYEKAAAGDPQAATAAAVDELLASVASAEHFARHWLDAARYGDTHGIHIDNYRSIWPYRDWVIRAFQANQPWDQFTIEQIAGDLLPEPSLDQVVATGFSRCLTTTGEGGAIPEEYDALYATDRVETMSAVWLGLTTGCAACHDHKFDPISTREFYSLAAFFRNTPMSALDGNSADHPPNVFVPMPEDRPRWEALGAEIAKTDKQFAARQAEAQPEFDAWLATASQSALAEVAGELAIHLPLDDAGGPVRGVIAGEPREWPAEIERLDGPAGKAAVISGAPLVLGDFGSFSRSESVTFGGFIRVEGTPTGAVIARMNPNQAFRGWDLYLQAGRPASHVIDTWDQSANKWVAAKPLTSGQWHHVMFTFDGTKPAAQMQALYLDGKPTNGSATPSSLGDTIEAAVPLTLGSRDGGDSRLTGKVALQDFRFYRRLLNPAEIAALASAPLLRQLVSTPADQRTPEQRDTAFRYFIDHHDERSMELAGQRDALLAEQNDLRARGAVSLVMKEKADEPFAHVLNRGVYSDKGERVTPATPAVLPPMPENQPKNRLGLAHWLVDPSNPLPARVTMNRTWYYFFGSGLVESNSDFGIMGAPPSHPKLLDWLAAEFVDSKWDYRHMLKLMVTSAAYRQGGEFTPEKRQKDPGNRLISRGPRHRLDAEQIRDLALASSGLLSPKVGGPPVKPYQPIGIWEAVAMKESNTRNYVADTGEGLYRRSLYTLWKRTAAPPTMEIFDAPTREVTCVKRDRTNTPLQALVLLNDPQFVESARQLASHAIQASSEFDERVDFITTRLNGRKLDAEERQILASSLETALADFRARPDAAKSVITTGATPPRSEVEPPELAAWTLLASQVLNLDETITR
jgi:hypothetical protein